MAPRGAAWRRAVIALAVVFALDQAAKALATASIGRGGSVRLVPGLELTNVRNTGIAFGALADGGAAVVALTVAALVLLVAYFLLRAGTPLLWLPVGMLLGGALGNLADRARTGTVIDFVDPIAWPAFNLADAAIVLGVAGLLWVAERDGDRPTAGSGR